jgi:hypothetical protein
VKYASASHTVLQHFCACVVEISNSPEGVLEYVVEATFCECLLHVLKVISAYTLYAFLLLILEIVVAENP